MTTNTRTMADITLTSEQIHSVKMTAQDFNINSSLRVDFLFYVDTVKAEVYNSNDPRVTSKNMRIAAVTFLAQFA